MKTNKRLKMVIGALALNFITVWLGMYFKTNLTALGTCLAMINTPLFVYVLGESFRPSKLEKNV